MKSIKKLLLISLFILTGCGSQEIEPLISDGKYYTNYELQYYYGNEGETFTVDLEKDIFSDGMILSWNNELTKLKETYDSFELFYTVGDDVLYFEYEKIGDFKANITFPSNNQDINCRLINTKENKCSNDLLIGYVYVKQKEYIELNSFDDLLKNGYAEIESKTFVLNNDLDFNDFEDVWNVRKWVSQCTFINPNNYVIRNLDFKDEIMSYEGGGVIGLFDRLTECYFDNLIFENVIFDYDTYGTNTSMFNSAVLAGTALNCVFKNMKILDLKIIANKVPSEKFSCFGGLVSYANNAAFINNSINLDIKQTGEFNEQNGKPMKIIGGLAADDGKVDIADANEIYYGKYILTYKRFPAKYNKITGKIQGIDVVGGLFGTAYKEDLKDYEYNIIDVEMSSSTGNVGEINGGLN